MADCIFCRMVSGEIPAEKVYEDEAVLAFLDIGPVKQGHTLVIPKQHAEQIHECKPVVLAELGQRLVKIAKAVIYATKCDGYNILCNNGRAAGQVVEHVHFHIIPRNSGDGVFNRWPAGKYLPGQAEQIGEKIRNCLD